MPAKSTLKARLAKWKPPRVDASKKAAGPGGREFPDAIKKMRGGGFRPGSRP